MTSLEGVDRLGRLYDWTAEERDHIAALVAEARSTFASARSEQDRLAEWVLANCPGEPSQDGGVVDTVIRLITSARADLEEARQWAWHGYEIGQRSATWSDQGVAPRWLLDGPPAVESGWPS